jgi:hypothetical protein
MVAVEKLGGSRGTAALAATMTGVALWLALRDILPSLLSPLAPLLAALASALLLQLPPALRVTRPPRGLSRAVIGASALALVLGWLDGAPTPVAANGAVAVAALTLGVGALCLLVPPQGREAAHGITLATLVVIALSPVWLAPWLDAASRLPGVLNTLVAMNPLTLLAGATALDYLRADWFYRHSTLGSLRYDYPELAELILGWLGVGAGLLFAAVAKRSGKKGSEATPQTDGRSAPRGTIRARLERTASRGPGADGHA